MAPAPEGRQFCSQGPTQGPEPQRGDTRSEAHITTRMPFLHEPGNAHRRSDDVAAPHACPCCAAPTGLFSARRCGLHHWRRYAASSACRFAGSRRRGGRLPARSFRQPAGAFVSVVARHSGDFGGVLLGAGGAVAIYGQNGDRSLGAGPKQVASQARDDLPVVARHSGYFGRVLPGARGAVAIYCQTGDRSLGAGPR
jgi:hypothetical protein